MPQKSSRNIGRKSTAKKTSENADRTTLNGSMSLQAVSHVKIFPMPDEGQDLMASEADCSSRPFAWFENSNPDLLCWRTWQRCLLEGWTEFSGRWPRSGMMRNGIAYRLPTLVPRISGTGCSYWLTPRASDSSTGEKSETFLARNGDRSDLCSQSLASQVREGKIPMFPTPDANCGNRGPAKDPAATHRPSGAQRQMTINDAVKMWPTPKATDGSKGGRTEEGARKELARGKNVDLGVAVKLWPTPTSISPAKNGYNEAGNSCGLVAIRKRISDEDSQATGQLNPMWVEWLMGFPLGWTDLGDSGTQ